MNWLNEACQEFKGCLRFKDFLKLMRLILDFQERTYFFETLQLKANICLKCQDKERAQTEAICIKNTGRKDELKSHILTVDSGSLRHFCLVWEVLSQWEALAAQKCKTSGSFFWKWTKATVWHGSEDDVRLSHYWNLDGKTPNHKPTQMFQQHSMEQLENTAWGCDLRILSQHDSCDTWWHFFCLKMCCRILLMTQSISKLWQGSHRWVTTSRTSCGAFLTSRPGEQRTGFQPKPLQMFGQEKSPEWRKCWWSRLSWAAWIRYSMLFHAIPCYSMIIIPDWKAPKGRVVSSCLVLLLPNGPLKLRMLKRLPSGDIPLFHIHIHFSQVSAFDEAAVGHELCQTTRQNWLLINKFMVEKGENHPIWTILPRLPWNDSLV